MTFVKDDKAHFIHSGGTSKGVCYREERLDSTPALQGQTGVSIPESGWGSVVGKLLRENIRGKGDSC